MSDWQQTMYTDTREGRIPHLPVWAGAQMYLAPVMIEDAGLMSARPKPLRRDGALVYALPGGVEVVA